MKRSGHKILLIVLVGAAVIALRMSPLGHLLSFENLKQEQAILLAWVREHAVLSVVLFIALYVAVAALSIPGAAILTMAGGGLFGAVAATVYVNIGATLGASLAFLASRYLFGDWLQSRYERQLTAFNKEIGKNGARYLLSLRLVPVFPFFLINILAGFTRVPLRTFAWTTALGIVPGTAVYAYAGKQLASIRTVGEIASARVLIAFTVLGLAALLPALVHRMKPRAGNIP